MVKARPLLGFYSNLDDLRKAGYISIQEISDTWGHGIQRWLAVLTPLLERERGLHGDPTIFNMDELVADLQRAEAKRGLPPRPLDAPAQQEWLDFAIEAITEQLRLESAWKSGVIPKPKSHAAGAEAAIEAG